MRKALVYTVGTIGAMGIAVVVFVFAGYLQPSAKAKSQRSTHDISTLAPGEFRIEPFGRASPWYDKVLLIKDWDESLYVYLLPTENGKVSLPDRWWGYGYYHCSNFSPETDREGRLRKGGIIKCHDQETPEWGLSLWQWAYDGSPKGKWGIEMDSPPTEVINGTLYINR